MNLSDLQPGAYNFAQVLLAEDDEITAQCNLRGAESNLLFEPLDPAPVPDRFALAISGGGIRSAAIGLGVLQGLARTGLLPQLHYISAISGGGYITGWLTAWVKREQSLNDVSNRLGYATSSGKPPDPPAPGVYVRYIEPFPLHYLRRYTSYLAPRAGLFSGDTLALVSVYLRNVLLNQLMLASLAIALMLVLQLPAFLNFTHSLGDLFLNRFTFILATMLFVTAYCLGIGSASQTLHRLTVRRPGTPDPLEWRYSSTLVITCGVIACTALWLVFPYWFLKFAGTLWPVISVALLFLAGLGITLFYGRESRSSDHIVTSIERNESTKHAAYVVAWIAISICGYLLHQGLYRWLIVDRTLRFNNAYAILGLPALLLAMSLMSYLWVGIVGNALPDGKREWLARAAGYFLAIALLSAGLFAIALYGPVAMHLLFTSLHNATWKKTLLSILLPGGWLFTVVSGVAGARSAQTSGASANANPNQQPSPSFADRAITIAPPVFLIGVLLLTSWASHALVSRIALTSQLATQPASPCATNLYLPWAEWSDSPASQPVLLWYTIGHTRSSAGQNPDALWADWSLGPKAQSALIACQLNPGASHPLEVPAGPPTTLEAFFTRLSSGWWYCLLTLLSASIAVTLGLRLDVNEFSLHLFYRNRLVRAFLGASRRQQSAGNGEDPRRPSPFTGFAKGDDILLSKLTAANGFEGPYPIWGTTLNLTTGEDLAWQERKGASFIYSALFCGWDYVNRFSVPKSPESPVCDRDDNRDARARDPLNFYGYRSTRPNGDNPLAPGYIPGYGGDGGAPLLGTAMAASGAAVSPNMGYHTRPGVAALLALFNLRLGWWSGNPRNPGTWNQYAPPIGYLAAEIFGAADDRGKYVYLSDGGHFENLGLYELIRRRVRFIICSDGDADPGFAFGDLGNAIDHCRRDFGVEITISAHHAIAPASDSAFRSAHYALGEIRYPGQTHTGTLLYLKSSLTSDEPADILGMKAQDKAFPHDSTANQNFTESMFEAYRALGQHMIEGVLHTALENAPIAPRASTIPTSADLVRAAFDALNEQRTQPA